MAGKEKAPRRQVDWAAIRTRIEATGRALTGTVDAPERTRAVLEERARALARPVSAPRGDRLEAVRFDLGSEQYAIESRYVIEVFRLKEISPLPGAEPPLFGITGWRGELLTILDLRSALGLSVTALNDLGRVIVLGEQRPAFGILADAVHQLVSIPAEAIQPPPQGLAAERRYLKGITGTAVLVLDAKHLLAIHGASAPR